MKFIALAAILFLCCCGKQNKDDNKLSEFISFASKASINNEVSTKFNFKFEGSLILLPPYATDQHIAEIKNLVGSQAAEKLRDRTGSKEVFWIALFERNRMIGIQKVDPSTLLFTEVLMVKFERNETISLIFGKNRKVKNIVVSDSR
jgi:hypothetical protein